MFPCPNCSLQLVKTRGPRGLYWRCPVCGGRSATLSLLRKEAPPAVINELWRDAKSGILPRRRRCPACDHPMAEVPAPRTRGTRHLDVCTICQFVWFDAGEFASLPILPVEPVVEERLPQKARELLAIMEVEKIAERARAEEEGSPEEAWKWLPGLFGMPVEHDVDPLKALPWATWGLAALIAIVSLLAFTDPDAAVQKYGLIPAEFDRLYGLTFFSSFLLHGGVAHLLGNLYFLLVFGDNVEDWLGRGRFLLLLLCATLAGDVAHILGDPASTVPCIGASGGISGVICYYALAFPKARLGILIRIHHFFRWVRVPAGVLFLFWLALQAFGIWAQLAGFSNVSALAHVGGAVAGCVFWLFTRKKEKTGIEG